MANIQIRNVPEDVHQKLRERAAKAGMSLSDYLLRDLQEAARRPTMEEWLERLRQAPKVHLDVDTAEIIREGRDERFGKDDEP